jgi:hypothetical protein
MAPHLSPWPCRCSGPTRVRRAHRARPATSWTRRKASTSFWRSRRTTHAWHGTRQSDHALASLCSQRDAVDVSGRLKDGINKAEAVNKVRRVFLLFHALCPYLKLFARLQAGHALHVKDEVLLSPRPPPCLPLLAAPLAYSALRSICGIPTGLSSLFRVCQGRRLGFEPRLDSTGQQHSREQHSHRIQIYI